MRRVIKRKKVVDKAALKAKARYQEQGRVDWRRDDVIGLIRNSGLSLTYISNKSGVSTSCLRSWEKGTTRRPQAVTMSFALRPLGYDLVIGKRDRS